MTLYARRISRNWIRDNQAYLRTLDELSAPDATGDVNRDRREFPAIAAEVERAVAKAG